MLFQEKELEEKALQKLKALGYEEVIIKNEADLKENFKKQFLKYNADYQIDDFHDVQQLREDWFDELEFQLFHDNKIKSVLNTFERLREKHNVPKRDAQGSFFLELFNKKDWCKNLFQVGRQVVMEDIQNNQKNPRYDLVLFINGLPLVLIELKKRGGYLKEAFEQMKSYSLDFQGLFRYIEILIISNGNETEYFANQEKPELLNKHRFQWSNADYQPMNQFIAFIEDFLKPCRLAQIIARYIFLHQEKNSLLIMRPHQIHATEKLLKLAQETDNNGYIWHTTGSGKTFTSFALCDILQRTTSAQIFFLTDRKELDLQTFQEFYSFDKNSVEKIETTNKLKEYFSSSTNKIVATLIHKMNKLINNSKNTTLLEKWRQKEIFFMIDECHRTQAGIMHQTLKNTFPQARFFGFTGTPFFEDKIEKNQTSTEKLFGECKHSYTMFRALQEKQHSCIIPFSIRYLPKKDPSAKVEYILKNHCKISQNRKYNAIFVTQDIKQLLQYYELFQKERPNFKIAAIFSQNVDSQEKLEPKQDLSEKETKQLETIMTEYGKGNDILNYHQTILQDMKKGGGTIDLLIVVRMFLTGFDSPLLNALYVDRPLKKHELFQAFSRTIRKESVQKEYGEIYCFQTTEKDVHSSLEVFAFSDKEHHPMNTIVRTSYEEEKEKYEQLSKDFLTFAPTPQKVDQTIRGFKKKEKEYLSKFYHLKKARKNIETYRPEFELDQNNFSLSEEDFLHYQDKYKKIRDGQSRKIKKTSLLPWEEEKQKYKEYIQDLRQIVPTSEDVFHLNDEDKITFLKNVNDLENQLEIMREYFPQKFHMKDFALSEEELKFYKEKRDQFDKEDKPPHIIDLDYLCNLYIKFVNKKIRSKASFSKASFAEIKKELEILFFPLLSNFDFHQKKLWQDFLKSDSFEDRLYKWFKDKPSFLIMSENFLLDHREFVNRVSVQELEEKANEFKLPCEELNKLIEKKEKFVDKNIIRKSIYDLLRDNPQTIDIYRQNNAQSKKIPNYKLKTKLVDLIYDFIKYFIQKYHS